MSPKSPDPGIWRGRRVFVTGHTGFKGGWLVRWLASMGAEVHGIALEPPTTPSLYACAAVGDVLSSDRRVDVRDSDAVSATMADAAPSVVFHLAAQPLVRDGFRQPMETFETNALGTVNVLEAIRRTSTVQTAVIVTTDKVYLPPHLKGESLQDAPHCEDDPLGAEDPYGWSKVIAEHAVSMYRGLPGIGDLPGWSVPVATARAGNVIGGGDWSRERLVPDCMRAFEFGGQIRLRFPDAVRPWQHVLEPLSGYLLLAERLLEDNRTERANAYNFGPLPESERTVRDVARMLATIWGVGAEVDDAEIVGEPVENPVLRLDSSLARAHLGWKPRWGLQEALRRTVEWHQSVRNGQSGAEKTDEQISEYLGGRSE